MHLNAPVNDLPKLFLSNKELNLQPETVFRFGAVNKTEILRDWTVKNHFPNRGLNDLGFRLSVKFQRPADSDFRMQTNNMLIVSHNGFVKIAERLAFPGLTVFIQRKVIRSEDHVLRRHGNRAPVGRLQEVAGRQHQEPSLSLRFGREGHMNGHLVAVEIGIVSRAGQRMEL